MEKRTRRLVQSFWDKDSEEKERGIITESPTKNLWSNSIMEKKKKKKWFVNISEYHHRTMELEWMIMNEINT